MVKLERTGRMRIDGVTGLIDVGTARLMQCNQHCQLFQY
jgi:hypothetical protein